MSDDLNRPAKTPIKDLRAEALAHYDELSTSAHSWLSVIPRAINLYFDHLESTETLETSTSKTAAETRIERLEIMLDKANETIQKLAISSMAWVSPDRAKSFQDVIDKKVIKMFAGDLIVTKGSNGLLAAFFNYRNLSDYTPYCVQQENESVWDFFGRVIQENRKRMEKLEDLKAPEE